MGAFKRSRLINSQRAPFVVLRFDGWLERGGGEGAEAVFDGFYGAIPIRVTRFMRDQPNHEMRWRRFVIERISRRFDPPDSHR